MYPQTKYQHLSIEFIIIYNLDNVKTQNFKDVLDLILARGMLLPWFYAYLIDRLKKKNNSKKQNNGKFDESSGEN